MRRRDFVKSGIAVAGATLSGEGRVMAQTAREFYLLRKYTLQNGVQLGLTQTYFEAALIPALNRMGITPVGAFALDIGPETPTYYLLVPGTSVESLVLLQGRLAEDAEFLKTSSAFWSAPAAAPAFVRVESTLMSAFSGWPKLTVPKKGKRIFQMRTYESASNAAHLRKVKMFNDAEIAIFTRSGLAPVFFGETLVGSRMPSLTYMLTFADVADLNAKWPVFIADPEWKDLSKRPGNTDAEIVSNITNLYLSPLRCSQI